MTLDELEQALIEARKRIAQLEEESSDLLEACILVAENCDLPREEYAASEWQAIQTCRKAVAKAMASG